MVAEEDAPLAVLRDLRGLRHDLRDRVPLLASHRHEDARHHRKMEPHVALVAAGARVAEVLDNVRRPLVRLAEQDPVRVIGVYLLAQPPEELVRLRQVLAVRPVVNEQVRDRVQPQAVDTQVQPEAQRVDDGLLDGGLVEVQVRLVAEEPVPEVLLA
jgi:hypothetical protein